jgi:hypothetical protein
MIRLLRAWLLACLAMQLVAAASAADGRPRLADAKTFVEALYAGYVSGSAPPPQGRDAPRIFAPDLLRLIRIDQARAGGEVGALDHDPLCACQDYTVTRVQVRGRLTAPDRARFDVRFDNGGTPTHIALDLVHLPDAGWRVSDVHNTLTPSLDAFLRRALMPSR